MKKSDKIKQSAIDYAKKKGLSIDDSVRTGKVDPKFAAKVAQAYQNMHHNPNDPKVKASYDSMIQQTAEQYKHLKEGGLKLSPIKPGQKNPYAAGSKALLHDLHNNNHMWYYPTEQGFGGEGQESKGNPLLKPMGENIKGHNLLANDMFRIVHDYFGHGKSANTFGAKGEENAYREHKQMFTPSAHGALTSETRGQNSWVNFGPHGEQNRKDPANTKFAEQKTGLMPKWTQKIYKGEEMKKSEKKKVEHGDHVYLSHGRVNQKRPGVPMVDKRQKYVARGKVKSGYRNSMWVVPHGEKDTRKGFYHRHDRLHHVDGDHDHYDSHHEDQNRKKREMNKSEPQVINLKKGKNAKIQKEKAFGRTSQPSVKSPQRDKHMEHIKDYAMRRYGLTMNPSGGKVDEKTGERRSDNPQVGVDKPDWRSGNLEAQQNPDAMVHELGHLEIMPKDVGLEDGQRYMDQQYSDVQRQHGYMKQKVSQGEIQPMGIEQLLRRRMGLPANRSAVPVKPGDKPRMAVDTNTLAGTRITSGKDRQGNPKQVDLIRQSRFVSPENRERVDKIDRKELVYDKKRGWIKPDVSTKQGLKENINSVINTRAREKAKDPSRKDKDTLMRSEDGEKE